MVDKEDVTTRYFGGFVGLKEIEGYFKGLVKTAGKGRIYYAAF